MYEAEVGVVRVQTKVPVLPPPTALALEATTRYRLDFNRVSLTSTAVPDTQSIEKAFYTNFN